MNASVHDGQRRPVGGGPRFRGPVPREGGGFSPAYSIYIYIYIYIISFSGRNQQASQSSESEVTTTTTVIRARRLAARRGRRYINIYLISYYIAITYCYIILYHTILYHIVPRAGSRFSRAPRRVRLGCAPVAPAQRDNLNLGCLHISLYIYI